ncbi:hypothetical protein C1H46_038631 [Malus baccata]|uniref:Uncharacterized protein n=1 Tax=Malus baccata TaxID=106549 RepID=A0A540KNM6_MALBA|nr:hypothetical protein C1H46_038631 [Malus baccata]
MKRKDVIVIGTSDVIVIGTRDVIILVIDHVIVEPMDAKKSLEVCKGNKHDGPYFAFSKREFEEGKKPVLCIHGLHYYMVYYEEDGITCSDEHDNIIHNLVIFLIIVVFEGL